MIKLLHIPGSPPATKEQVVFQIIMEKLNEVIVELNNKIE